MQERKAVEAVLKKQLKVEGFFDKEEYHILLRDRETKQVFKRNKAESLRSALLCLSGTGFQYPVSDSIIKIEGLMQEGRFFMLWKEDRDTIFYLSNNMKSFACEDILALAACPKCRSVTTDHGVFKFYRGSDDRSIKIVTIMEDEEFRSFVGFGDDISEAAKRALQAMHPSVGRKKCVS